MLTTPLEQFRVVPIIPIEIGGLNISFTNSAFSMMIAGTPVVMVKPPMKPWGAQWAPAPRVTTRLKHEADGVGYVESGFSHLFIIPSEGGSPRQITSGDYFHRGSPQWSVDGNSLIFVSNRSANWEYEWRNSEIYSVNLENGNISPLTDRDGPDQVPIISPDGKHVRLYIM